MEKPRACGCEVSPLRRAAHGSGRNDEGRGKKEPSSRAAPAGGVSKDGPPFPPPRHFDRSAGGAEWRNLVRAGARFLHSAVPRTAPVEMTRGAPFGRLLGTSKNETLIPSSPRRSRIEGRPAFPPPSSFRPERRRRGVEKPRACGCEVSPLRRAAHGSGRNDEGGALRAATRDEEEGTLIPSSYRRGRIEGRPAFPPHRHFDRSAAGARFLRCAVPRTAPVEMTRGAPFGRLLGMRKIGTRIPSRPRRGRIEGRPATPHLVMAGLVPAIHAARQAIADFFLDD